MRLGQRRKKSRAWREASKLGKHQNISSETVVGQVSLDLVGSVFAPKIKELAKKTLEQYADDVMQYEEAVKAAEPKNDVELSQDGTIKVDTTKNIPPPPKPPLFYSQFRINEFEASMNDISEHFFAKSGGWRVSANAARFERMLDEKYGVFRPFITAHPEVEQFIRSFQRKLASGYFSPLRQTDPPIPRSTAIILLFMMQRNHVRWEIMVLVGLFLLIGLQPWALVAGISVLQWLLNRRKCKPIGTMKSKIPLTRPYYQQKGDPHDDKKHKYEILKKPVGDKYREGEYIDMDLYDTIIVGHGAESLYTASLLSRAGRKVLVLSERTDASGCLNMLNLKNQKVRDLFGSVAFDVESYNVSKISKQQEILAPAIVSETDYQGGVRFAQIGSEADGYAFQILSIPGVGTDSANSAVPFVLRASGGVEALMDDAAIYLGDGWPGSEGDVGHSTTGAYVAACESINASASLYYMSKILPDSVNNLRSTTTYQESSIRYASSFLERCFPLNMHVRSLMAGIGMTNENIKPSMASMAPYITNTCAVLSEEGMHYPVGGPRSLCAALATVVEQSGGRILTEVLVDELLFDETVQIKRPKSDTADGGDAAAPACVGVKLTDGTKLAFRSERFKEAVSPVIVCMGGFISTFVRFMPEDIRTKYKVPRGLPALSEQRPVLKILFALQGSAGDLSVTGADYYRLPGATIAKDVVDPATGVITHGEIGWVDDDNGQEMIEQDIAEEVNKDPGQAEAKTQGAAVRRGRRFKFETGKSWLHVSFPSAKDPSFQERHGDITTCVVTIEADDDFVTPFDTKPKVYVVNKVTAATQGNVERLIERVKNDLLEIFPQLEDNILHCEVHGPYRRGLSHNPERYAAKGVRADTPYPGLFVGGSDLTVGQSFSAAIVGGWLVANAVVGFSPLDHLFLKKNITSDLARFVDTSSLDSSDLAVPYEVTAIS